MLSKGSEDLRAVVRRVAADAGASAVRITSAERDEQAAERMEAAFARGDFATWPYDRARAVAASDPTTVLPGARSVVVLAVAYAIAAPKRRTPLSGRVSNYAWGADYHARVRTIANRVAEALDEAAGEPVTRVACDTAPLAERAFAARAGLGWIGKHTNLIAPGLGSYVFLAEVVTTLELSPDSPSKKTCGTCARCVPACPTGALRGDYTIDATRCISDLTQRTDAIPRALRPFVGDWVWGCDLCQEVCPPTQGARPAVDAAFAPRDQSAAFPDLLELLRLRGGAYRRRVRPTAMGWRGAAVLRRNAAIALGNALDRAAVSALETALAEEPNPLVRGHVAWALGRIGSPRAVAALRAQAVREREAGVLEEVRAALGPMQTIRPGAALNDPEGLAT